MFQPDPSLDAVDGLARMKTFVSPYSGVVSRLHEILGEPDDARLAYIACEMASREPTVGSRFEIAAGGAHYEREGAIAAALGEALERYSGTCVPRDAVLASAAEIGPEAVAPERFALYSEGQYAEEGFGFEPFRSDTKVRWVKGISLPDRAPAYLPLQLAYIMRPGEVVAGEAPIAPGSSNGMALATGPDEAILGGLLELLERDAVMLTWSGRLSFPRLDWSSDPGLLERERRHFAPTGLVYGAVDMSAFFGVPTALALLRGPAAGPVRFGIGAASAVDMHTACDKALRECFQMQPALKSDLRANPDRGVEPGFGDIEEPADHLYFYSRPENQPQLDFLDSSERVRDIADVPAIEGSDPGAQVEAICRRLSSRGVSAYAVDVTSADVRAAGLRVMRVISPELQPIDFPHRERFLGGRRLYRAAHELGLRERPLEPVELNPYPHPFP